MKISEELEKLKPIITQLSEIGYKNVYINFDADSRKFAIEIKAENYNVETPEKLLRNRYKALNRQIP